MYGAISALLLASCVKDEVYNTSHPDKGAVSIHVNLPQGMGITQWRLTDNPCKAQGRLLFTQPCFLRVNTTC